MRIRQQRSLRFFEYRYCQVATDRRKVIKEHLQWITGFEMIEQGLDWNSGSGKNRRAAMNLRVNRDELLVGGGHWSEARFSKLSDGVKRQAPDSKPRRRVFP